LIHTISVVDRDEPQSGHRFFFTLPSEAASSRHFTLWDVKGKMDNIIKFFKTITAVILMRNVEDLGGCHEKDVVPMCPKVIQNVTVKNAPCCMNEIVRFLKLFITFSLNVIS
ncbi:hypothetical protein AMECASPLE_033209, partial [Ameca splendens]